MLIVSRINLNVDVLARALQPLVALHPQRLSVRDIISDRNVDRIHVQYPCPQLSACTIINIDCAHRGRYPAHVPFNRRGYIDLTYTASTGWNPTVFQYEVLGEQYLVFPKGTGRTTVGTTRFKLLDLTPDYAIGSATGIFDTNRYAVLDSCPGVCPGVVCHQPIQVLNCLIPKSRTMKLDEPVVRQRRFLLRHDRAPTRTTSVSGHGISDTCGRFVLTHRP